MRKEVKTKACIVLAVSLCVLSGGFAYSVLNPWSRINCIHEGIDIRTGRVRFQRYIFFIKVTNHIKKTDISKMWQRCFGEYPDPLWRRVNTFWGFDVGGSSPHHAYHGALAAARMIEKSLFLASFSEEAQKKAVHTFLQLLQVKDSDKSASQYAHFVAMQSIQKEGQGVIEEGDIPSLDEWVDIVKKEETCNLTSTYKTKATESFVSDLQF